MDRVITHLTEFGLSEKEARIYVALVEIRKGTAYAIAKQSGLKRPTVYLLLDNLRKKDLVIKVPHAKNQMFIAKDPEEFFSTFEDKLYKMRKVIPELLKTHNQGSITTHLFDGKHEMEEALAYRRTELEDKEMYAFYGVPRSGKKISDIYYNHARALERQDTKVKVFAPDDASLKKFREKDTEYGQDVVYLSQKEYFPKASIEIGENFSKIFLHTASQVLVIEGKEFSGLMKQIFELVWKKEHTRKTK